ncbi:hypothetical protein L7F22_053126 [Adiantum nelumboides]|nr:hypothetical protein [Adiantum nelumboides]
MDTHLSHGLRCAIGQIRTSSHQLEIEFGRFQGILPEDRLCKLCGTEPETELHYVKRNNSRYTRAAFTGWRLYVDKKIGRKAKLKHAEILILQGLISRSFKSWCFYILRNRKYKRFLSSVQKILHRHLLQRIWKSWVAFVRQRVRKDEDRRKDANL